MNKYLLPFTIATLVLTGCGSDSSSSDDKNDVDNSGDVAHKSVSGLDGRTTYAYYDLDNQTELSLTAEEAKSNTEWDVAFNGVNVILNGGHSGAGNVEAYFTGNNADFVDDAGAPIKDKFVNATPETELADFTAINSENIPAESEFDTDTFKTIFGSNFYVYNFVDHSLSENDSQKYLVSTEEGHYIVRATSLSNLDDQSQVTRGITELTLGVQFKANSAENFTDEQLVVLPECNSQSYVDLTTFGVVTDADGWDLTVFCNDVEIQLGDGAKAYAYDNEEDWLAVLDSLGTPYEQYSFEADGAETFFGDKHGWFAYDLNGEHKIWSQYGVYLVKTDTATYKLQITSYYGLDEDNNVSSGLMSFIYQAL